MSLKASNFSISSTSAGDSYFGNCISLFDTTAPIFSMIDFRFVWIICPNASFC